MILDIEFVVTLDGLAPTKSNSSSLTSEGRGSVVLFNESTTYHTGELDHDTKSQAAAAGVNVKRDFKTDANTAFNSGVLLRPLDDLKHFDP